MFESNNCYKRGRAIQIYQMNQENQKWNLDKNVQEKEGFVT
jgi:hypothetical protein